MSFPQIPSSSSASPTPIFQQQQGLFHPQGSTQQAMMISGGVPTPLITTSSVSSVHPNMVPYNNSSIQAPPPLSSTMMSLMRVENEKLKLEKEGLLDQSKKYFEMAYLLNVNNHKLSEMNSRLNNVLSKLMQEIPEEKVQSYQNEINQICKVTVADIEKRIKLKQRSIALGEGLLATEAATVPSSGMATESKTANTDPVQPSHPVPIHVASSSSSNSKNYENSRVGILSSPSKMIMSSGGATSTSFSSATPNKQMNMHFSCETEHAVSSIALNPTAQRIYVGGKGCIKVLSVHNSTEYDCSNPISTSTTHISDLMNVETLPFSENAFVRSLKIARDESTMYACGETNQGILCYDLERLKKKLVLQPSDNSHSYSMCLMETSDPNNNLLFTSLSNGSVAMWDLRANHQLVRLFEGHKAPCTSLDFSNATSSSPCLLSAGLDKTLKLWDINSGSVIQEYCADSRILTMCSSPASGENLVVLGLENGSLEILNSLPLKQQAVLYKHADSVLCSKFSPTGKYFVAGGKDCILSVNKILGSSLRPPPSEKHFNSVLCCDIQTQSEQSNQTDVIAVGSWDKKVYLYNLRPSSVQ
ncbi:hypothetical protein C9374_011100 [Naegleria lovaniensis]|uniref:Groucho/TLE N-terminal Q-rich domain-containing protein n=1 Tax=Naegleria lovaniensis TaxID=51637 RepID=A0AA88GCK1_NAELO|nr:uncharacterized protein C9374_011100 [Naegleria lovaniensis]KAG2374021.1 hypothetical protein C9374_011100 [Naegleria lovaniensis]